MYTNNPSVLIRVDAHKGIALGHLKRCLSLSYALRRKDESVSFLTVNDEFTKKLLQNAGFEQVILNSKVNSDEDCDFTMETAYKLSKKIVIVDSYQIDAGYRKKLMNGGFFTVSIDDMADKEIPSHIIINSKLNAEKLKYKNESSQALFLGIKYLMLAPEFWNVRETKNTNAVENVLITMGGIDHYDLTSRILAILESVKLDFNITVIVGPYYENLNLIQSQISKTKKSVSVINSPSSLYPYMQGCSVAFSAGGQTLYELAALGVPTIGITLWENQAGNVQELSEIRAIEGIVYSGRESFNDVLRKATEEIIFNSNKRKQLSQRVAIVIDGKGAERACDGIMNAYEKWSLSLDKL